MMGPKLADRDHGDQLSLAGLSPLAGKRWVNQHTKMIATVVRVQGRRHVWVTVRYNNLESEIRLGDFLQHYSRL
jgi:hypothetical protein